MTTINIDGYKNLERTDMVVKPKTTQENPLLKENSLSAELCERPASLMGKTYKIKTCVVPKSMYVTINYIERNGSKIPFEIFIQTCETSKQEWTTILARMMSNVMRRGVTHNHSSNFIVKQLRAVHSVGDFRFHKGRKITSAVGEIGEVLESFFEEIGYGKTIELPDYVIEKKELLEQDKKMQRNLEQCPHCLEMSLIKVDGCKTCTVCGESLCG